MATKEAVPGRKSDWLSTSERWIGKIRLTVVALTFGGASLIKMIADPPGVNLWALAWVVLASMATLIATWGARNAKDFILDAIRALPSARHPFDNYNNAHPKKQRYAAIRERRKGTIAETTPPRFSFRDGLTAGEQVEDGDSKSKSPAETGPTPTQSR